MLPQPGHSIAAKAAITTELVRLTIGQRGPDRPELMAPIFDDCTQHQSKRRRKPKR